MVGDMPREPGRWRALDAPKATLPVPPVRLRDEAPLEPETPQHGNITAILGYRFAPSKIVIPPQEDAIPASIRFGQEMAKFGLLTAGRVIGDGQIHRVKHKDDKKGRDSGWYIFHDGGVNPGGAFGSWRLDETHTWASFGRDELTSQQREEHDRYVEESRKQIALELKRTQDKAAEHALQDLQSAAPASPDHPYLKAKGVGVYGPIRQRGDGLLIPIHTAGGDVRSYQRIYPLKDGGFEKRMMAGGEKKGCMFEIPGALAKVYIVEGYSTGATVHEATGCKVVVAFDAGNLVAVAEQVRATHPAAQIILAGDNDAAKVGKNTGVESGMAAANRIQAPAAFPQFPAGAKGSDWNDLAAACGIAEVRRQLGVSDAAATWEPSAEPAAHGLPPKLLMPSGFLGDVVAYYNATCQIPQPGFAVQSALACASTLLGRCYCTTNDNYTALYFVNIGKSSAGKEHGKTVGEDVFEACGVADLMSGGGFTSAGAVFSSLLRSPVQLAVIDELGKYLASAKKSTSANGDDANRILMEAIARCHGVIRPHNYSEMTIRNPENKTRLVIKPSITILSMTTPSTFYENLGLAEIKSGFLGRFIVHQSHMPRRVPILRQKPPVPQAIVDWYEHIRARHTGELQNVDPGQVEQRHNLRGLVAKHMPDTPGHQVVIGIDHAASQLFSGFAAECIERMDELEKDGIEDLIGRHAEFAMRLALIHQLSDDPYATSIGHKSADWGVEYMRYHSLQIADAVRTQATNSDHERARLEVLAAIRANGANGITQREMRRNRPFTAYDSLKLSILIKELEEGKLIDSRDTNAGRGRPRVAWVAIDPRFSHE